MIRSTAGLGLLETVVVVALIGLGLAVSLPALAEIRASALTAAGARRLAVTLQSLRWKSVAEGRSYGLLFRRDASGWYWDEVRDGNGNGLRTSEVESGVDATLGGHQRLESVAPPARLGFSTAGTLPAIPPGKGTIDPSDDPIRMGNTNLVAFGPIGTSSSGTLFVTDGGERLYAVVMFGKTGRVRVWRYEPEQGVWLR